jgi:rare lipoprotein A
MTGRRPWTAGLRAGTALAVLVLLAACGSAPKKPSAPAGSAAKGGASAPVADGRCNGASPYAPAKEDPSTRGHYTAGGLYKPGVPDRTPDYVPDVDCIPEPVVVAEPRSQVGNRSPYTVLGKQYKVLDRPHGYVEQGIASYYGSKFHGRRTSNMEVYDMYAFTAAHKTLPLPSFARVTNLENGKSVVVRVNDRGPFHDGRVIDLSYAAAVKLGIVARGTGRVEVRALVPGEDDGRRYASTAGSPAATPAPVQTAPATPATALDQLVQALPPEVPAAVASASGAVAAAQASLPPPVQSAVASAASRAPAASTPLLQVASFSSADNARRALERLLAAGISDARLEDTVSGGRTLWRLRVPAAGDPAELALRIAGLGFGTPQPVRD